MWGGHPGEVFYQLLLLGYGVGVRAGDLPPVFLAAVDLPDHRMKLHGSSFIEAEPLMSVKPLPHLCRGRTQFRMLLRPFCEEGTTFMLKVPTCSPKGR